MWCRDIISRLVEEGRLSNVSGSEGARFNDLRGGGIEEENEDEDDNKEFNDVPDIGPNGLPIWDGHVNDLQVIEHELNVVPGMR